MTLDTLGIVAREASRIGAVARGADLERPVPSIPEWTAAGVIRHLGAVHRWCEEIVRTRDGDAPRVEPDLDGDRLVDWFDEGWHLLVDTLSAADPAEPCPNFSRSAPQTVGFWRRRQAHETTIHRWDVESAVSTPTPIEGTVAADGIDELIDTHTLSRGRQVLDRPVRFELTDRPGGWTLAPSGESPGRVVISDTTPAAVIRGPAETMVLVLWKRLPFDSVGIEGNGDVGAAAAFVAGPITS